MENYLKKIIVFVTLIFFFINILLPVIKNWSRFSDKFNYKIYEKKYNLSQYIIPQSKNPISDEELLSYAGYKYITGTNPILINSDHPPLGKYLIGLFTIVFSNNRVVSLLFGLGNIFLILIIILSLTKSITLSSLGLMMLSLDSMFIDQIINSPMLDIIQVFFLLLYFYIFIKWLKTKKISWVIFLGITLGCLSSIKLYFPSLVLLLTTGLFLLLIHKKLKSVIFFIFCLFLTMALTYCLTYLKYFLEGNSLRSFLGVQKWVFLFWKNNAIDTPKYYGSVIPLILFNQWKVWWGNKQYIQFINWRIFWPIFFIGGIYTSIFFIYRFIKKKLKFNKKNRNEIIFQMEVFLSLWTVLFTIYLCFLPISPRYLMMIFFPLYIIITLLAAEKLKKYV